jgi:hypothetical protein
MRPDTTRLHDPVQATKTALQAVAARVLSLTEEITTADQRLKALLANAAPHTMALLGVSTEHAGSCWSPPDRIPPDYAVSRRSPPSAQPARFRPAAARPTATPEPWR